MCIILVGIDTDSDFLYHLPETDSERCCKRSGEVKKRPKTAINKVTGHDVSSNGTRAAGNCGSPRFSLI